jgi:hypothetical protein
MASRLNESTSSSLRTFPWWFERIVGNGMILRSLRHFRLEKDDRIPRLPVVWRSPCIEL